jgi:hypothetical protein
MGMRREQNAFENDLLQQIALFRLRRKIKTLFKPAGGLLFIGFLDYNTKTTWE